MIPLYLLGLLQRFGPQHGYSLKQIVAGQLSDFTQIKLPAIYYHLEKMEVDGLLAASRERAGSRPQKTVYSITDKGAEAFQGMLRELLEFDYRPTFPSDGIFYFSDTLESAIIIGHLTAYIETLHKEIAAVQDHRREIASHVPAEWNNMADIIFSHHERHYRAELEWAVESLKKLGCREEKNRAEAKDRRNRPGHSGRVGG